MSFGDEQLGPERQRTALVTGITGQDGAYLAQLLLGKGYRVIGTARRSASGTRWRLERLGIASHENLIIEPAELQELARLIALIRQYRPDEVYNLAAQSYVAESFVDPLTTVDVTGIGPLRLLEAVRSEAPHARFYQAASSEQFGDAVDLFEDLGTIAKRAGQNEATSMHPRSPYAAAKLMAYWLTRNYREAYGMHASCGILFNHESPLRGAEFVTRKVVIGLLPWLRLGRLCEQGRPSVALPLSVGNLDAQRDWGFAGDYVEAMWRMLQQEKPGDYVIATGETHTVREWIEAVCATADVAIRWQGSGTEEVGMIGQSPAVVVDPAFYRPAEVPYLRGIAARAAEKLGWKPATSFTDLARMMVEAEMRLPGPATCSYYGNADATAEEIRAEARAAYAAKTGAVAHD